jgi:hypothetical protein
MKVFIAGFDTETNTFAPIPTGYQSFADCFLAHGDATSREANYCSNQLLVWRRRAEACGWPVVESLCTFAEPGGRIVRPAYETLRDELLADLARAMPVDMVILALHGAMPPRAMTIAKATSWRGSAPSSATGCRSAPSSTCIATSPTPWCAAPRCWSPTRNIPISTSRSAPRICSPWWPMRRRAARGR